MIVDSASYCGGARSGIDLTRGGMEAWRGRAARGDFVWVGLHDADVTDMALMSDLFALPPLAVEDALTTHQRPKVEPYDDLLFIVLKTLWYSDDQVETGQVSIFLGPDFAVTVRQGEGASLATVRHDLETHPELLGFGPSAVAYAVADRVVDAYEDVAAELETDVDEVETSVFSPDKSADSQRIYVLKREIAEFRRAVHPLKIPVQRFATTGYPFVAAESANFFRDVADHVVRVAEVVDTLDMLLSTAFEAHLSRISVQQNEDMRKISAWVAIAGVITLIAGVYGMNFEHMPELGWHYGYAWALGLMAASSLWLYAVFKRAGWI